MISNNIRDDLLQPLKNIPYYSIIADEVTDPHANQQVLSLCLRFIETIESQNQAQARIKEAFIDFCYLERATGHAVSAAIFELLRKHGLDVDNMRGQAYDGASSMSGEKNGVQAIIRQRNPLALYTHCSSHVLSLAIGRSSSVQPISHMIEVINEVFLFFHLSPKRQRFFEFVLDRFAPDSRISKLKGLCKTRWTERHDCLETFHALYVYIYTTLHAICDSAQYPDLEDSSESRERWTWDGPTRITAEGLKCSLMSGSNIIALIVLLNGLDPLKGLSAKLQKRDADVVTAYNLIDKSIQDVYSQRQNIDALWTDWYGDAQRIAVDIGSEIQSPRVGKFQRHRANTPADNPR